jgi:hypothetical protein
MVNLAAASVVLRRFLEIMIGVEIIFLSENVDRLSVNFLMGVLQFETESGLARYTQSVIL